MKQHAILTTRLCTCYYMNCQFLLMILNIGQRVLNIYWSVNVAIAFNNLSACACVLLEIYEARGS